MHVSLTPTLEKAVRQKIKSGLYNNASEVMREALRLMLERESGISWLRSEAARGFEQLDRGAYLDLNKDQFLRRIRKKTRVRDR